MKLHIVIYLSLLLFVGSGCSDFLDVQPKDKQSEKQLFATRSGFYTAANGIYNRLGAAALYGRNLTYEMIDVLAFYYKPLTVNDYYTALINQDYANKTVKENLSNTWSAAYTTILNCNVLLKNLEASSGILNEQEKKVLTGEMLALRAFLHLDMLRLFGPVYATDPSAEAIPYNESAQVSALPILPADTVMTLILRDIHAAEELLEGNDPVIEGGAMASLENDEDVYLRYRQLRFNYYAVLALKARAYLYAGDKVNALAAAHQLLTDENVANHFPAVNPSTLLGNTTNPDRIFSTEVLMGFYNKARADIYTNHFNDATAGNNFLQPTDKQTIIQAGIFRGESGDYRFQAHWVNPVSSGTKGRIFIKYKEIEKPVNGDSEYFHAVLMPLLRLSEVYYIAAECEPELADGYVWLNQMRAKRGTSALSGNESNLVTRLISEYSREFFGEGQRFFLFKRLNRSNLSQYEDGYDAYVRGQNFTFAIPLPTGETENR